MADFADVFSQFAKATVSVKVGSPPNYDRGRVIIEGNPDGFRLLASVLNAMADAVGAAGHPASQQGWHLGLSPDDLRWLKMDDSTLVLDCTP
jgi:hypothetical protein